MQVGAIVARDVDGDGRVDVLASSLGPGGSFAWFESQGRMHRLAGRVSCGRWSVGADDIDGDGALDPWMICLDETAGRLKLLWFQNRHGRWLGGGAAS